MLLIRKKENIVCLQFIESVTLKAKVVGGKTDGIPTIQQKPKLDKAKKKQTKNSVQVQLLPVTTYELSTLVQSTFKSIRNKKKTPTSLLFFQTQLYIHPFYLY